jgi:hypothetical protein
LNDHKSLIMHIAEWWETHASSSHSTKSWNKWLPSPGNILFTFLIAGLLIFTQKTWANNGPESVNVPGPSATTVNYQGRLADSNGNPINGNRTIQFAIYDATTGGNVVWGAETHANVPVTDGLFNVGLGSQTSGGIPTNVWNGARYLQITVGGEALSPRELIRSVPIAGMALTVPNEAIGTGHITNGSITKPKLAQDVVLVQLQGGQKGASYEAPGWNLHQGTGSRGYTTHITFSQAFDSVPVVLVSLSSIDASTSGQINTRISVSAGNITQTGFDLNFTTWADSIVYGANATWMAYAEQ